MGYNFRNEERLVGSAVHSFTECTDKTPVHRHTIGTWNERNKIDHILPSTIRKGLPEGDYTPACGAPPMWTRQHVECTAPTPVRQHSYSCGKGVGCGVVV